MDTECIDSAGTEKQVRQNCMQIYDSIQGLFIGYAAENWGLLIADSRQTKMSSFEQP